MQVINEQHIIENKSTSSTDSSNERKRRTKEEKYTLEREKFINQVYKISGFDKQDFVSIKEIETNKELKIFLLSNVNLIKKYWKTGLWSYFTNKNSNDIVTLFRTLLNNINYNLYSKQKVLDIEGEKKRYNVYYIE